LTRRKSFERSAVRRTFDLKINILIYFEKTGINPLYSGFNPIVNQSWSAYEYLRRQDHRSIEIKAIEGGHQRHPEVAYAFWRKYWPKSD